MLTDFRIENYRSVKSIWLKLKRINVIVGPNGSGKSNLYRAMYLVASTANGQFARNLVHEGGIASALWSGDYSKRNTDTMRLSVRVSQLQYDIHCGKVNPMFVHSDERYEDSPFFRHDPEIKEETVCIFKDGKKSNLLNRGVRQVEARDWKGVVTDYTTRVPSNESVLTGLREPHRYPHLSALREEFLNWRFYHHFRTDRESPLRKPQVALSTDVMSHDGSDFICALATIAETDNRDGLLASLDDAFPGAQLDFALSNQRLRLLFKMPDLARPLEGAELSDGTLQYLCLLTAFYSLRAPSVLAINEPETSIHPSLFEPLARLIVSASEHSQMWITTHSRDLADYILEFSGYEPLELEKVEGETRLVGVGLGGFKDPDDDDDPDD